MQLVKYPVKCQCGCKAVTTIEVNLFNGEHTIVKPALESNYLEKWEIVSHYKTLKNFDKYPTWDKLHKQRAMKRAGEILRFFGMLEDRIGVAKECMTETNKRAVDGGWNWTLETITKIGPDWLAAKEKKAAGRR